MVEFWTLGAVDDFCERTGQEATQEAFAQYTAALALGRAIDRRPVPETGARTYAGFVRSIDRANGIVQIEHFDELGKAKAMPDLDLEEELEAGELPGLREGGVVWLTLTLTGILEIDGQPMERYELDVDAPSQPQ